MSKKAGSQKFIGRNRPPRVQITYDHETLGANKKVELPLVVGVMADLSAHGSVHQKPVNDRKFREIRQETFDQFMESSTPELRFAVEDKLTGKGRLAVDLKFKSLDDFTPGGVARNVEPLRKLLEARTQLNSLLHYMDGKQGAENLINQLLENPQKLKDFLEQAAAGAKVDESAADAAPDAPQK